MNSFAAHGFPYELFAYNVPQLVPGAVRLRPAESILPPPSEESDRVERFSDLFRYSMLDRLGGWWVDTDVVCNTSSMPAAEVVFAFEDSIGTINNGTLKFPAGHPHPRELLVRYQDAERDPKWGATGPKLATEVLSGPELDAHRWKQNDVYPIHWAESWKLLLPDFRDEVRDRTRNSVFIHLYTSMWRRAYGFDERRFMPLAGSFLGDLYLEYGYGGDVHETDRSQEQELRRRIDDFLSEEWAQKVLMQERIRPLTIL